MAAHRELRQRVRPPRGGRARLDGRAEPGARALRHDGAARRPGAGDRAGARRLRGGLVPGAEPGEVRAGAVGVSRDGAQLSSRRPLQLPAGGDAAGRSPDVSGPGAQPGADRQGRAGRVLSRRHRPGHRRRHEGQRRPHHARGPRRLPRARRARADRALSRRRPGVLARPHRRRDGAGDPEHPGRVPVGEGRLADGGGPAPARQRHRARVPRPVRAPRRSDHGQGAVRAAAVEGLRPRGRGRDPAGQAGAGARAAAHRGVHDASVGRSTSSATWCR